MTKPESERLAHLETKMDMSEQILKEIKEELKKQTDILTRFSILSEKINSVDMRVQKLESNQSRGVWTLITIIIGALMASILRAVR